MEDDFGELYAPFSDPSASQSQQDPSGSEAAPPPIKNAGDIPRAPSVSDALSRLDIETPDVKSGKEDDNRGLQLEEQEDVGRRGTPGALTPNIQKEEDDWKSDSDDDLQIVLNEDDPVAGKGSVNDPYPSPFKYVRPGAEPLPRRPFTKTIFDVDIDTLEEKPWRRPGADLSDYFNYDLNEDTWKDYRKSVLNHPGFSPKLAATAAGRQGTSMKHSQRANPTGRPIPVVMGSGERLFSGDLRPSCMRDSDSAIEIPLQGSVDNDPSASHGSKDQKKNDPSRDDLRDDAVERDDKHQSLIHSSHEKQQSLVHSSYDRDLKRIRSQDVDSHRTKDRHGNLDTEKNYKGYERRERDPHGKIYASEDSCKPRDDRKRRDHFDKDDRKRTRDEILDQRERTEQRCKGRDDGNRFKRSYQESSSRRDREDGQYPPPRRSRRHAEDKEHMSRSWKEDYKGHEYERDRPYKDTRRYSDKRNRKGRDEDASDLHDRHKEKRSRQEKSTVRDTFKKSQEETSGREEVANLTGTTKEGKAEYGKSDDDVQHHSKRRRSKVERWERSEARDYGTDNIPASSQRFGTDRDNNPGPGSSARFRDDVAKKSQAVYGSDSTTEGKEGEVTHVNQHLDTTEKLKERSARFKLPIPVDRKNVTPIKKMESESPSSARSEAPGSSEVKPERSVRPRRS